MTGPKVKQLASQQQFIVLPLWSQTYQVFVIHPPLVAFCNVQNIFLKLKAKKAKASKANVKLDHISTAGFRSSRAPTRSGSPPSVFPGDESS